METNRREFIALGGAAALALSSFGQAHAAGDAEGAALSKVEEANAKVVADFCAAWDTMDVEKLSSFWDDEIVFRNYEGRSFRYPLRSGVVMAAPTEAGGMLD